MTDVQGRCPACHATSLFLGEGGHVTCARLDCPNPSAADELLHGEHVATTPAELERRQRHAWSTAGRCPMCGYDGTNGRLCSECVHTVRRLPSFQRRQWDRYRPITTGAPLQGHGYTPAGLLGITADDEPAPDPAVTPAAETAARYAQAVARVESSGPKPAPAGTDAEPGGIIPAGAGAREDHPGPIDTAHRYCILCGGQVQPGHTCDPNTISRRLTDAREHAAQAEQQRDQLAGTLREILDAVVRSGGVPPTEADVDRWRAALQPPARDAGPSVAEAAAVDRNWDVEKAGE